MIIYVSTYWKNYGYSNHTEQYAKHYRSLHEQMGFYSKKSCSAIGILHIMNNKIIISVWGHNPPVGPDGGNASIYRPDWCPHKNGWAGDWVRSGQECSGWKYLQSNCEGGIKAWLVAIHTWVWGIVEEIIWVGFEFTLINPISQGVQNLLLVYEYFITKKIILIDSKIY